MASKRQPRNKKQVAAPNRGADPPARDAAPLIAGVGASAGGLQAFTQLLEHLPGDPGMALVLVQHLAPKHASALTELLSRTSKMPVSEVNNHTPIESGHVYVIPPDSDMEVCGAELHLVPRAARQHHMPIDHFLNSLAADRGPKAIGVIFSGTASDGTLGLKAIKAAGGTTFAQDPQQADHAEMPRNAIAAGCVDFVLPIESIARELLRIAQHPYLRQTPPEEEAGDEAAPKGENERRKIYRTLHGATGVDFTHYKSSTIWRRIRRRMMLLKLDSLEAYTSHLQKHRDEVDALFQDMLIHVTGFFRDPEVFEALKREVFPNLVKDRPAGTPIRVWISGCSTGEEAYSVAMVLLEFLSELSVSHAVQIFATDVNEAALEKARQGEYLESIATDVSPERLRRFFMKMPHGYRINKSVRDLCIFARHDIGKDPPFSRLDLITCRNLLIYLGPVLQKRILPIFHYALKSTGYLLLGSSETIGSFAEYFSLVDKKHKLYRARPSARPHTLDLGGRTSADVWPARGETETELNDGFDLQKEANRILLTRFSPPGIIIDDDFKVVHFHGRTGRYLEPAPGNASLNLARMAREGLHVELRAAVQEARRSRHSVRKRGVLMKQNAHMVAVDIDVIPIKGPAASPGYCLVLFQDAAPAIPAESGKAAKERKGRLIPPKAARREINQLKDELSQTRHTLQSTIEELEATNEELRSANEESLSSNEELQSTNEELETAKEELQSANEELTTLNEELQNRNNALNIVNNDLINLLGSVDIPIVMLGSDLRIRRFTPSAEELMNIVNADIGRPVGDIKLKFELPGFQKLIADAIDNTAVRKLDVQALDGNWYSMRIRPYKTTDHKIDGAVVNWLEVTGMKQALDETTKRYKFLFERNLAGVFYVQDGRVLDCNETFARILGHSSREEALQAKDLNASISRKDQAEFHDRLVREKNLNNELIAIKRKDGRDAWIVASATLTDDGGTAGLAVDITKQVQMEKQLSKLTRYLMKESDDRRRQLARELHDQLGSSLGALLASLAAISHQHQTEKELHRSLSRFQKQLQNCIKEVQTVSYLQHPLIIEQLGLAAAVRWYAEDFSKRTKIRMEVSIPYSMDRMDEKIEIALYRIIQECLTNVQRHSGSKAARVTLEARNGRITAEIRDSGKGFIPNKESMGIMGMRERMKELGGDLEVESGEDGTTVRAVLNLAGAKRDL